MPTRIMPAQGKVGRATAYVYGKLANERNRDVRTTCRVRHMPTELQVRILIIVSFNLDTKYEIPKPNGTASVRWSILYFKSPDIWRKMNHKNRSGETDAKMDWNILRCESASTVQARFTFLHSEECSPHCITSDTFSAASLCLYFKVDYPLGMSLNSISIHARERSYLLALVRWNTLLYRAHPVVCASRTLLVTRRYKVTINDLNFMKFDSVR